MKKLENKVFLVIFLILTVFLISILMITNYQNYQNQRESIRKSLFRMDETRNQSNNFLGRNNLNSPNRVIPNNRLPSNLPQNQNEQPRIFMDSIIYAIRLDENNNIVEIINHTPDDVNEEKIKRIVATIIEKKGHEEMKISDLIFDDYSYLFLKNGKSLIIMDNTNAKNIFIQTLTTSFIIFAILELVIIYISKKLTSWMIKPVIETFNKQKQFITDASHELKTPLSVIIASSEELENNPKEKKWLNNIKSESERMNYLITDLLEMAKSENGIKEQYVIDNLSKAVERGVLTFESLIFEKDIKLDYDIQKNIMLLCDINQIKQLVSILIDNSIKHSSFKGEIIIKLKKEKGNIIFSVTNKGKEIPKEEREKIFERFYRADESRNRSDNRYGLGLAIAKNIVTNHSGDIQVNCENGYTTFKVTIKS